MTETKIPIKCQEVFEELKQETIRLNIRWIMYSKLFEKSDKRTDLLNEIAPRFFRHFQLVLIDDIILGISRVTDRPKISGRSNLVLSQLIECLDYQKNGTLVEDLKLELRKIDLACEPIRKIRNRFVAHLDLQTVLKSFDDSVPGISSKEIKESLFSINNFMNIFELYFNDSSTAYEIAVTPKNVDFLIVALRKSVEYDLAVKEEIIPRERLREGKYKGA